MKKIYAEFYDKTKEEFDALWKDATIVFDANVLLDLYKYSDETRISFLSAMSKFKDRLWLPYQVGFEYHKSRLNVIYDVDKEYDSVCSAIEKNKNDIKKKYFFHTTVEKNLKKLLEVLDKVKEERPDFKKKDVVLNELEKLYDNKIEEEPSYEQKNQLKKNCELRYKYLIPPGYKDAQKTNNNEGGDYYIWQSMIDYSKNNKKDIIFISNEKKEDWWNKKNTLILGIRTELLREFSQETNNQKFHIYDADNFLEYAKKYESVVVSASVRNEVKGNIASTSIEDALDKLSRGIDMSALDRLARGIDMSALDRLARGIDMSALDKLSRGIDMSALDRLTKTFSSGGFSKIKNSIDQFNIHDSICRNASVNALSNYSRSQNINDVISQEETVELFNTKGQENDKK